MRGSRRDEGFRKFGPRNAEKGRNRTQATGQDSGNRFRENAGRKIQDMQLVKDSGTSSSGTLDNRYRNLDNRRETERVQDRNPQEPSVVVFMDLSSLLPDFSCSFLEFVLLNLSACFECACRIRRCPRSISNKIPEKPLKGNSLRFYERTPQEQPAGLKSKSPRA